MNGPAHLKNVLLIDDERIDQMMYRRVMDRSGLVGDVIGFQYADEALEYLKRTDRARIDVIFLDINMPRMNGFEFLQRATEELGAGFATAVVIMLTTSLDPSDVSRAKAHAVVKAFINKPLTVEHVHYVASLVDAGSRD